MDGEMCYRHTATAILLGKSAEDQPPKSIRSPLIKTLNNPCLAVHPAKTKPTTARAARPKTEAERHDPNLCYGCNRCFPCRLICVRLVDCALKRTRKPPKADKTSEQ